MNGLTVRPRAQQIGYKDDLLVNLCERYVFGGLFQCGPMQYYEQRALVSNPVYISSSIIYASGVAQSSNNYIIYFISFFPLSW